MEGDEKMMKINTGALHYKVWKFTYCLSDGHEPTQTTLCAYVWRTLLFPLPIVVLVLFALVTVLIVTCICNIITIPLGIGTWWAGNVEGFPKISVGGRVVPWWAMLSPLWALAAITTLAIYAPAVAATLGGFVLFVACVVAVIFFKEESESWQIIKAYFRARTENYCPTIVFVKSPAADTPQKD
ncbi:MAG: hypothetical protein WC822_06635 [Candidatus Paceibacterota bacterium]|jgi:hypothetical protein